ncbi:hypothetical protein [Actinoallomurus soli]|uniref:hypothetical protein n=1 Tax=Actinoallomurus soli TaxID=2952535 RepID=UPI002092531B|nr:hypothetical protein [Actinoallomurus soli]MCO5969840.1 hypothetical protein [Actinoallomurus soli]
MRRFLIMTVAALAVTSACSSGSHPAKSTGATRADSPKPNAATESATKANIPGFSGPIESSSGVTHVFGTCLKSWYTPAKAGTRVHVAYPGPANVSVDLLMTDHSEPPPEAHKQFTLAQGQQTKDLRFPAIPHAGYAQITVTSGSKTLTCDAAKH